MLPKAGPPSVWFACVNYRTEKHTHPLTTEATEEKSPPRGDSRQRTKVRRAAAVARRGERGGREENWIVSGYRQYRIIWMWDVVSRQINNILLQISSTHYVNCDSATITTELAKICMGKRLFDRCAAIGRSDRFPCAGKALSQWK